LNFSDLLVDDLELEVKVKLTVVEVVTEVRTRGANCDEKVGHREPQLMSMVHVREDVGMKADGVLSDGRGDLDGGGREDGWLGVGSFGTLHGK